jgi:predicted GNAT family acetyltransferase
MRIEVHDDPASFAKLAMPLLLADPVRNTIAVTALAGTGSQIELERMVTVHRNGRLCGAALQNPGWPLIVSALPGQFAPAVAAELAERNPDLNGAAGPVPEAEAFADAWQVRTGATRLAAMSQRLFELVRLTPPSGVPGRARVATVGDIELLAAWCSDFADEAVPASWPRPSKEVVARQLAAGQGFLLWELDGEPVAMALASRPAGGMSRVAGVWTPPAGRGRGFGSAVTAAASRWALDAGARHIVLFTDLANPISNAIYPRIGYQPRFDAVHLTFQPAA